MRCQVRYRCEEVSYYAEVMEGYSTAEVLERKAISANCNGVIVA